MIIETFYSERPITVKISPYEITFHFKRENDRMFYDIPKGEWCKRWETHMEDKNWFTQEMKDFIDKNV